MLSDEFERLIALPNEELGKRLRQVLPYIRSEIDRISASADSRGFYDLADGEVKDTLEKICVRLVDYET